MSPRFDQMRKLVWQSKRLQQRMSAKETETWSKILRQEETLSRRLKSSLRITPLDGDDDDDMDGDGLEDVVRGVQDKRKRELISIGDNSGRSSSSSGGRAELVADENPIDELLKRHYNLVSDQHEIVVAPENDAGELDLLYGVVDDVPPDVLFDLIASCSGADDAFRLILD
jgi:ethylene-insensitive protein 3